MNTLNISNVFSTGWRIYRHNFVVYFRLAFIGCLWSWIPLYGWAKFYTSQGLISRLAFGEISENPESIKEARRYVKPRMWSFFIAAIKVCFKLLIAETIAIIIIAISFAFPLAIVGIIAPLIYIFRLYASYFISEVPLAVEDNLNATLAIARSVELTKGYLKSIVAIMVISSLISLPFWGIIVGNIVIGNSETAISNTVSFILSLVNTAIAALIIPLWQCIKVALYRDLQISREVGKRNFYDKNFAK